MGDAAMHLKITPIFLTYLLHSQLLRHGVQEFVNFVSPKGVSWVHIASRCVFPVRWKPAGSLPVDSPDNLVPLSENIKAAKVSMGENRRLPRSVLQLDELIDLWINVLIGVHASA